MSFRNYVFPALVMWVGLSGVSQAQLDIDLQVDITEENGIYNYVYTLANDLLSFQSLNSFLLDTGSGAEVLDISGPENWVVEYLESEPNLQASFITGVSADGETCGATTAFDVQPGNSVSFSITSTWAPEDKEYIVGQLVETTDFPCDFEGGIVFGEIASPAIPPDPLFAPCDFDEDGDCDTRDINNLAATISSGEFDATYDLTLDSLVNRDDLDAFLTQAGRLNGDADFNGSVEFADFLTLSGSFGLSEAEWTDGDFDASGGVEFADFLILSGNFGQTAAAAELATVPEPTTGSLAILGMVAMLRLRRR